QGIDVRTHGLRIHTTIDSRLQELARAAVEEQLAELQAVVDYEWSREDGFYLGDDTAPYVKARNTDPFGYFWQSGEGADIIRETPDFARLRQSGIAEADALSRLRSDDA